MYHLPAIVAFYVMIVLAATVTNCVVGQPLPTVSTVPIVSSTSTCTNVGSVCDVTIGFRSYADILPPSSVVWTADYCSKLTCNATGTATTRTCLGTVCTYTLAIGSPTATSVTETARFSVYATAVVVGPYFQARPEQLLYSSSLSQTSLAATQRGASILVALLSIAAMTLYVG